MQHVKTVKLGEICEINPSRRVAIDNAEPVSFLTMADVSEEGTISNEQERSYEQVKKGFTYFKQGDVLVAKITPCFENGKGAFTSNLKRDVGFGSTEFHVIRPKEAVDGRYVFYLTRTPEFRVQGRKYMTGSAGQQRVPTSFFQNYPIPLPDLDTQRHIAAVLDKANALRQKDRQLLGYYEQLPQAVFLEMFGDEQAIKHRYEAINLCEVADIVSGVTKNAKQTGTNYIDVPYMRVANVQDGRIDLSEIKTINVPPSDLQKFRLQLNDILLTEGGDPDKLGRGAVWHDEIADCIHQNHIFRVRPNQQLVNPTFLSFLIGSRYGKRYFLKAAKQTTGIASINMQQLKRFPAVVPPVDIQNQFSHAITEIEQQKKLAIAQLATSEALFQSLLHESFGIKAYI